MTRIIQTMNQSFRRSLFKDRSYGIILDSSRICLSGSSAGGYLTLLAGLYYEMPKVLLPIYSMANPHGKFFSKPQLKGIKEGYINHRLVATFLDSESEVVAENDENSLRDLMYNYMLQEAILPQL
jgi:hypothetical protein